MASIIVECELGNNDNENQLKFDVLFTLLFYLLCMYLSLYYIDLITIFEINPKFIYYYWMFFFSIIIL